MATWRYEEALAILGGLRVYSPPGSEYHRTLSSLTNVLGEAQLAWRVTVSVLSHGVLMAIALRECEVVEREQGSRQGNSWKQVLESAIAVRATWEGLEFFCQEVGKTPEQVMLACPVEDVVSAVTEMANSVLTQVEQLAVDPSQEGNPPITVETSATETSRLIKDRAPRALKYAAVLREEWNMHLWEG